jgi:membrane-bound ClpP family serine protease
MDVYLLVALWVPVSLALGLLLIFGTFAFVILEARMLGGLERRWPPVLALIMAPAILVGLVVLVEMNGWRPSLDANVARVGLVMLVGAYAAWWRLRGKRLKAIIDAHNRATDMTSMAQRAVDEVRRDAERRQRRDRR